jgi:hypothetical protein
MRSEHQPQPVLVHCGQQRTQPVKNDTAFPAEIHQSFLPSSISSAISSALPDSPGRASELANFAPCESGSVPEKLLPDIDEVLASLHALLPALDTLPPGSNTGGKSNLSPQTVDSSENFYPVHVDYLTFTVAGFYFDHDLAKARRYLDRWSGGLFTIGGPTKRYNGYVDCYSIVMVDGGEAPPLGWVGVSTVSDPMRGRWCFCLPGVASSLVTDWSWLVKDMMAMRGRITRVDLALDDLQGHHPLAECEALYDAGAFTGAGRPPAGMLHKNKSDGAGNTFEVGKRLSGKLLRCYEKGKQLGDSESPWVRYEGELHSKDRCVPWEVLLLPGQYLQGMYSEALSWMKTIPYCLKVMKEKARISLERAKRFAKQQVGRLLCYLREVVGMDSGDIVQSLSAEPGRYPMRLWNAARYADLPWDETDSYSAGFLENPF